MATKDIRPNGRGGYEDDLGHQYDADKRPCSFEGVFASYLDRARDIARDQGSPVLMLSHLLLALAEGRVIVHPKQHVPAAVSESNQRELADS